MNILRLDHAALLVKDVERSRQFYRQVLGMDEIPGLGAIWLAKGSAQIHLLGESIYLPSTRSGCRVSPSALSRQRLINRVYYAQIPVHKTHFHQ